MGLAEDSLKVERIVAGSYGAFEALYAPLLLGGDALVSPLLLAGLGSGSSSSSSPRSSFSSSSSSSPPSAVVSALEDAQTARHDQAEAEAEVSAAVVADAHLPPPSRFANWLLRPAGSAGGPFSSPESLARLRARSEAAAAAVERARAARLRAAEAARRFRLRLAELRAAALRRRRAGEAGDLVWRQDTSAEARAALLQSLPEALLRAVARQCGLIGVGDEAWGRALAAQRRCEDCRWEEHHHQEAARREGVARAPPLTDAERAAVARAALRAADYSAKRGAEKAARAAAAAAAAAAAGKGSGRPADAADAEAAAAAAAAAANASWPLRPHGIGRVVAGGLFALVGASSRRQALSGLLTTGPARSAVYLGAKLRKAWRTRMHSGGGGVSGTA
jgi:hypothetical protein